MANATEEYVVSFDWSEETTKDLGLEAGKLVTVLAKHEHGWWWYGQIGEKQGYFPKNYVKKRESAEERSSAAPEFDDSSVDGDLDSVIVEAIVRPFGITSLPAFDELVDNGIAVEVISPTTVEPVVPVSVGARVQTQICALTWDGTTTETKCFTRGVLSFTVGSKQVASGLDIGIQRLKVGDKAAIICAPFQAYGEPGNPPTVQPNSYIVFFVYIISCSEVGSELDTAVGPRELVGAGITTKFEEVLRALKEEKEGGSAAADADAGVNSEGGQIISDDMLSQAAASMGINSPPPPPPRR